MKKNLFVVLGLMVMSGYALADSLPAGPYVQLADCYTKNPVPGPTTNHIEIYLAPGNSAVVLYDMGIYMGKSGYPASLGMKSSSNGGTELIATLNEHYKETIFVSGTHGESGKVSFVRGSDQQTVSYDLVCQSRWAK